MITSISLTPEVIHAALDERFAIDVELGRGGQGVVFRAERVRLSNGSLATDDVALKVHLDPHQDERVVREIEVMERLRHPCLANLLEHGTVCIGGDEVRFIAWEFIEGEPLSRSIAAGPLSSKLVATIGRDVATAIVHIWSEHIVHRDVNPKNVMIRAGGNDAVLIDLGAARHLDRSALTTAGFAWGTPGYMSPEQARGETQLTCFSDVFTLGLTMVEALTGRHPTNRRQDLLQHNTVVPSSFLTTAPTRMTQLLDRMLSPRAVFRPTPAQLSEQFAFLAQQL